MFLMMSDNIARNM